MVVKLWNNTKHAENIIFLTLSDIGNSEPEEGKDSEEVECRRCYDVQELDMARYWKANILK